MSQLQQTIDSLEGAQKVLITDDSRICLGYNRARFVMNTDRNVCSGLKHV